MDELSHSLKLVTGAKNLDNGADVKVCDSSSFYSLDGCDGDTTILGKLCLRNAATASELPDFLAEFKDYGFI